MSDNLEVSQNANKHETGRPLELIKWFLHLEHFYTLPFTLTNKLGLGHRNEKPTILTTHLKKGKGLLMRTLVSLSTLFYRHKTLSASRVQSSFFFHTLSWEGQSHYSLVLLLHRKESPKCS